MKKAPLLIAAALVAVGACALLLVLDGGSGPQDGGEGAVLPGTVAAPGGTGDGEARAGPVDLADAGGVVAGEEGRALLDGVETTGATAFQPQPDEGVAVRVVSKETGRSIARATVFLLEGEPAPPSRAGRHSRALSFESAGLRYRTDGAGRATIPTAEVSRRIAAKGPDLWGSTTLRAEDTEVVLELERDPSLYVRVVDERDRPVEGLPVAIRVLEPALRDAAVERTDSQGRVRFEHAGMLLESLVEASPTRIPLGVGIAIPHEPPVVHPLGVEVPGEPIELTLPPVGRVEVLVKDSAGTLRSDAPYVWILPPGVSVSPRLAGRAKNGRVLFPYVGLGLELDIRVSLSDGRTPILVRREGPTEPGETRRIEVVVSEDVPVVVGMLVDAAGAPLAEKAASLTFRRAGNGPTRASRLQVVTDASGRFRGVAGDPFMEGTTRTLEVQVNSDRGPLAARTDLSFPLAIGPNDVGTLTLDLLPLLVAGTVVDDAGTPVAEAKIQLWSAAGGPPGGPQHWAPAHRRTSTASAADGSFELRGWEEGELYAASAERTGYVAGDKVPFAPGTQGLIVPMIIAGEIAGSVLVDESVRADAIIYAVKAGRDMKPLPIVAARLLDGSFTLSGIPAGVVRVDLSAAGVIEPLFSVEGVVVEGGAVTRDPRLQEIDLRGSLRAIQISARDVDGNAVTGLRVGYRRAGEEGASWSTRWGGNSPQVELVVTHPAVDVEVSAQGYRSVRLEGVMDDQVVTLSAGLDVRFALAGNPPPLPPNFVFVVTLNPTDPNGVRTQLSGEFGPGGEATIRVPRPGTYRAYASLRSRTEGRTRTSGLSRSQVTLQVEDSPGQVFVLELDADEVGGTIERMQGE